MATATETLERVVRAYSVRDRLTDAQKQGLEAWLSRATVEVPGRVAPAITAGVLEWERARDEELARLRAEVERLRAVPPQAPAREEAAAADEPRAEIPVQADQVPASDGQATETEEQRRTPRWLRR